MSNNLLSSLFDQTVIDEIREWTCNCGCGSCVEPKMIHSFIMTDSSPDFNVNSLTAPPGCTHWSIIEPSYHAYNWSSGKIKNAQFYLDDCTTLAPDWHTTLKGYSFVLEVWCWCDLENKC